MYDFFYEINLGKVRQAQGYTMEEVSEKTGIPMDRLAILEKDISGIYTDEFDPLAEALSLFLNPLPPDQIQKLRF